MTNDKRIPWINCGKLGLNLTFYSQRLRTNVYSKNSDLHCILAEKCPLEVMQFARQKIWKIIFQCELFDQVA